MKWGERHCDVTDRSSFPQEKFHSYEWHPSRFSRRLASGGRQSPDLPRRSKRHQAIDIPTSPKLRPRNLPTAARQRIQVLQLDREANGLLRRKRFLKLSRREWPTM